MDMIREGLMMPSENPSIREESNEEEEQDVVEPNGTSEKEGEGEEIFQREAIFSRPIREAVDTRLFDWKFLEEFSDRANTLY